MATQITHKPRVITAEHIAALREFNERGLFPDRTVQGLFLRIGDKTTSWIYRKWQRTRGRRKSVERTLGHWPTMQPPAARAEALKAAGEFANGVPIVGKADAVAFSAAFERYVEYLKTKAAKKGKPARWPTTSRSWARSCFRNGEADMAKRPDIVADWYGGLHKKTPASAGHCHHATLLRRIDGFCVADTGTTSGPSVLRPAKLRPPSPTRRSFRDESRTEIGEVRCYPKADMPLHRTK